MSSLTIKPNKRVILNTSPNGSQSWAYTNQTFTNIVNVNSSKVGIGTTTPAYTLDISNVGVNTINTSLYYDVSGTPINNNFYTPVSSYLSNKSVSTWTPQTGFPTGANPNRTAWSPELGLFAVTTAQGIDRIVTSPNGFNWTRQNTGVDLSSCNNIGGNNISCLSTSGISAGMSVLLRSGSGSVPGSTTVSAVIDISTFSTNNTITGLSNSVLVADSQYRGIIWCKDLSGTGYFISSRLTGTGRQIVTSTNGTTWDSRVTPSGFDQPHEFSYSPSLKRVICGSGSTTNPAFIYSDDGITWTSVSNPIPENLFFDSDWSEELGLFCSVAFSGTSTKKVILSRDGINWIPVDISANVSNSYSVVRWSPELGIFCVILRNTTPNVMISSDGYNWQFYSTPSAINYRNLVWSPQMRVFVAVSEDGTNRLAYSYDGKTWVEKNLSSTINSNLRGIAWSPELGIFCINGQTGTPVVVTSVNNSRVPTSYNVFDSSFNNINELGLWTFQSFGKGVPILKEGTNAITITPGENWVDVSCSASASASLPAAVAYPGMEINLRNLTSNAVTIASGIVYPINSVSAFTTTLLPAATPGAYINMVSSGSAWYIMQST